MADVVYTKTKALFAGKESFHVFKADGDTKQMISIGTGHNTYHLFSGEMAAQRKGGNLLRTIGTGAGEWRYRCGRVIHPFQLHTIPKGEVGGIKKSLDDVGTLGQHPSDDVDVHLVAIPAHRVIAADIPVAVYEVLHVTAVLFAAVHNIMVIN